MKHVKMIKKLFEMDQGTPLLLILMLLPQSSAELFCPEEKVLDAIHLGAHCIASSGMSGMQCNNAWDGDASTIWHPATSGVGSYTSISYPRNVVISKVRILQHHWSMGWADGVKIFINNVKIKAKLQHRGHTLTWDAIVFSRYYHTSLMMVMISSVKNHAFGGIREIQVFGCLSDEAMGRLADWQSVGHVIKSNGGAFVPGLSQSVTEDSLENAMEHVVMIDKTMGDSTTHSGIIEEESLSSTTTSREPRVKKKEPRDTFYEADDIFGFQDGINNIEKVYTIGRDNAQSLHDYHDIKTERASLPTVIAGVLALVILVFVVGLAGYCYRAGRRYNMSLTGSEDDRERYLVHDDDLSYSTDQSSAGSLRGETKC